MNQKKVLRLPVDHVLQDLLVVMELQTQLNAKQMDTVLKDHGKKYYAPLVLIVILSVFKMHLTVVNVLQENIAQMELLKEIVMLDTIATLVPNSRMIQLNYVQSVITARTELQLLHFAPMVK